MNVLALSILALLAAIVNCNICPNQDSNESASTEPCFELQQFEYDSNKQAQQEKEVELECVVRNKGPYSVAWLFENQLISLDDKVIRPDSSIQLDTDSKKKFNLKITNVDANHKGSYRCQISTLVAKNLEYTLDVLIPPSITRIPNSDVITLNEGESLTVQCLTQGNPKPKLTWSKRGEKAVHTTVDETKSTLNLQNVEQSHADTYSCTAKNGVGNPVTTEFQILIRFKPRVSIVEDENMNKSVLYSAMGRKEKLKCTVDSYPAPKISLLYNDLPLPAQSYSFEETKDADKQYVLTYSFTGSSETFGEYICIAENELGSSKAQVAVSPLPSEVTISSEKLPVYSDAIVFEWSTLSGSPIQELNVQVFSENNTNGTNLVTKTKQLLTDGTELPPTYHNENIHYKDFYDISKLLTNTSYTLRIRVRNEQEQWSEWSQNLTIRTHADENEKLTKHKSSFSLHHHRHHDRKHKNYGLQQASLNTKRDRFNSYISDKNSASSVKLSTVSTCVVVLLNSVIFSYFF